ncbi:MAG: cupin domain-containing protein [Hyphomicrobiales bacterium]
MINTKETYIKSLNLSPHPEGGFFREVYRSSMVCDKQCLPHEFDSERTFSTAIYYMLTKSDISKFHRIKSDELWHHYDGACFFIHIIHPSGKYECKKLGKLENDAHPLAVVPANCWFAAEIEKDKDYGLVGCTVSPGFDFKDFEMGNRKTLLSEYENLRDIINVFT